MKTLLATLTACAWIGCARAQAPAAAEITPAPTAAASSPASPETRSQLPTPQLRAVSAKTRGASGCCHLEVDTPVVVETAQPINSSTVHRGDFFALRLAEPVTLDNGFVIPAGTTGVGQVVDAAPSGGGGAPGKLVLAARHLDFEGSN